MRIAMTSLLVLVGLLIAAASVAEDHARAEMQARAEIQARADQEAIEAHLETIPSVEAPPPDTRVAQPMVSEEPVPAEAIDEPRGHYGSIEEPDGHYD